MDRAGRGPMAERSADRVRGAPDRLAGLRELFAAGDWELDERTKILEIDRVKLLWQDLTELDGGKAELVPFTMIFLGGSPTMSEPERLRQAFVLQAPKAELKFDRPLDLRKGDVGQLQEGKLRGEVTVRSRGKLPGHEDDFRLHTRDVDFNEQRLGTLQPVEFAWGRSGGRGSELEVAFLPGEPGHSGGSHGLNVGGLQSVKIAHLEGLRLDLGGNTSLFGKPQPPKTPTGTSTTPARPPAAQPEAPPVEVACRGPVVYDPGSQTLVFRDQVDVLQSHPNGPSDQVNCEVLAVCFVRRRTAAPEGGARRPRRRPEWAGCSIWRPSGSRPAATR